MSKPKARSAASNAATYDADTRKIPAEPEGEAPGLAKDLDEPGPGLADGGPDLREHPRAHLGKHHRERDRRRHGAHTEEHRPRRVGGERSP